MPLQPSMRPAAPHPCHIFVAGTHRHTQRRSLPVAAQDSDKQAEPDFIERMVGRLFGKGALETDSPLGMKRMTADEFPEMYPATTDEWAAPVEGDSPEIAAIRPLLAKTQLERVPLRVAYDAQQHAWTADAFHERVNTFGAGLLVARSAGGAIFGGYSPRGWIGLGEDRDAIAAFLFTWTDGDTSRRPIKLPKVGGPGLAVMDKPDAGIRFGAEGLGLLLPGRERLAKCRLGTYYARTPDGGRSLFAPGEDIKAAEVVELRCYVAEGPGESWALEGLDVVWRTS